MNSKEQNLLEIMPQAYAHHEAIRDHRGEIVDFRILEVNPAFMSMIALDDSVVVGKVLSQLWPEVGQDWFHDLAQVAAGGAQFQFAFYAKKHEKYFNIVAFCPESGGVSLFISDETALMNFQQSLSKAQEEAASSLQEKMHFLATLSHEVRTPINGIMGFMSLLTMTTLTAQQKEYIRFVDTSVKTLMGVFNDILNISRLENGNIDFTHEKFRVRDILEEIITIVAPSAFTKGLDLSLYVDPSVAEFVEGDTIKLRQVCTNLLNNAIKYTPSGMVHFEVRPDGTANNKMSLLFSCEDTGIGVSKDDVSTIFQPFSQIDNPATRKFGGSGLGLYISKRIVEALGGEIWVDDTLEGRTKFWFRLSFDAVDNHDNSQPVPVSSLFGRRILVVDDQNLNRFVVKSYLEHVGCFVDEAHTGTEALEKILQQQAGSQPYAAVLLDLRLPEKSALDIARELKSKSSLADIPLVLMISSIENSFDHKVLGNYFAGQIQKPIKRDNLLRATIDALHLAPVAVLIDSHATHDLSQFRNMEMNIPVLVVEDDEMSREFLINVLNMQGIPCEIAKSGEEAVMACFDREFDLVLMDCQMPIMSGFEATRLIRSREKETGRRSIIIAMTAFALRGDREKCLKAGMDDYVSKPLDVHFIFSLIEKYVTGNRQNVA